MSDHRTSPLRLVAVVLALGALLACTAGSPGRMAQDFTLQTPAGDTFTLSTAKGQQGVLLFFFASWCAACAAELPHVRQFADGNGGEQLAVYGISLQETGDTIADFAAEKQVSFPILLDGDTAVAKDYGIRGIPTLIGIDARGKIVFRDHALPADTAALARRLTGTS